MIISTGKADWPREVTDVNDSLAKHLSDVTDKLGGKKHRRKASLPQSGTNGTTEPTPSTSSPAHSSPPLASGKVAGVSSYESASRTSILNGSHHTISDSESQETVLVLPDYVAVTNVPSTPDGAEALWHHAVSPAVARAGSVRAAQGLQTWTLPYHCLILLCKYHLPLLRIL